MAPKQSISNVFRHSNCNNSKRNVANFLIFRMQEAFFVLTQFIHKNNEILKEQKYTGGEVRRQKSKILTFFDFQSVITKREMLQIS